MSIFSDRIVPASSVYRNGRAGVKPDVIILHHSATTNYGVVKGMMSTGSRKVSSNVVIENDGDIHPCVWESDTPFTNGHLGWNRRSYTAEILNSSVGGSWPVSKAAHEAAAQWCAHLHDKHGIKLDRTHVFGHRELYTRYHAGYATACPGGLDLDWIVKRARQIAGLSGSGAGANPGTVGGGGTSYPRGTRFGYALTKVQWRVNNMGYKPALDIDGIQGPNTTKGIKWAQKKLGVAVDGEWGGKTQAAYDRWSGGTSKPSGVVRKAPPFPLPDGTWYFGPKSGPKKSVSGYYSHRDDLRAVQKQMQARGWDFSKYGCDGLYGSETAGNVRAFQRERGLKVDGLIGPVTYKAIYESPII